MGLIPTIPMLTPDGDKANIGAPDLERYLALGFIKQEPDSVEEDAKEVKDAVDDKDANEVKEAAEAPKAPEAPADEKPAEEKPADLKSTGEILPE